MFLEVNKKDHNCFWIKCVCSLSSLFPSKCLNLVLYQIRLEYSIWKVKRGELWIFTPFYTWFKQQNIVFVINYFLKQILWKERVYYNNRPFLPTIYFKQKMAMGIIFSSLSFILHAHLQANLWCQTMLTHCWNKYSPTLQTRDLDAQWFHWFVYVHST